MRLMGQHCEDGWASRLLAATVVEQESWSNVDAIGPVVRSVQCTFEATNAF